MAHACSNSTCFSEANLVAEDQVRDLGDVLAISASLGTECRRLLRFEGMHGLVVHELVEGLLWVLASLEHSLVCGSSSFVLLHILEPILHLILLASQFLTIVVEKGIKLNIMVFGHSVLDLFLGLLFGLVFVTLVFGRHVVEDVIGKGRLLLKLKTGTEAELLAAERDQIESLK